MTLMTGQIGINHHITLAYCPWANGSVEIVGKELLWTTRAVVSELGYSATDWTLVLPLIMFIINHRERDVLDGHTPIEVMTGRKPKAPTDLVLWDGVILKDVKGQTVEWERVSKYCSRLANDLDQLHQRLRDAGAERRRKAAAKAKFAVRNRRPGHGGGGRQQRQCHATLQNYAQVARPLPNYAKSDGVGV